MNIAKIMIPKALTVFLRENNTVRQGLETMLHHGYTALPVLDQHNRYIGSITEGDLLRYIMDIGTTDKRFMEDDLLGSIMRRDFCPAITIDADEKEVIHAITNQNFVPIVDSQNALCGILTRRGVICYLAEE
ncbi:MAG: CBS domain-containing protein [Oscillospiraceae bacterium]|nr:CBS domain-containing protein [Oscillospiraceae bacterium]